MENSIVYTDIDSSCNVFKTIDPSQCYIREPFDLSNTFFREHFEGKEILLGQTIREYFYFTGAVGPAGPPGSSCDTFLNIYNIREQKVLKNTAVSFDHKNYVRGSCAYEPGTSQIHIWKPGFYHISTNIYHIESCQFSLFKNTNIIIPGTTMGSLSGSSQNTNTTILQITAHDISQDCSYSPNGKACIIELYNNTLYIPFVTLYDNNGLGHLHPQINANITIYLLNSF